MKPRTQTFAIGDRVKYSAAFLRSTGMYTGEIPFAKGTVTGIIPFSGGQLLSVDWGNPDIPTRILGANLIRIGTMEA